MDKKTRQQIALFRHGLIGDLVHRKVGERGLYALLRDKAERALVALREIGAPHLHVLPRSLGFRRPESESRKVRIDSNTKRGQIRRSTLR